MADKIVLMKDGRIEQVGTPDDLFDKPVSRYAADFIGSPAMNFVEGEIATEADGPIFRATGVHLALPPSLDAGAPRRVVCGLRPSDLFLDAGGDIEGRVTLAEKTGADQNLHVAVSGADVVVTVPRGVPVRVGQTVRLQVPRDRIHVFDLEAGTRLPGL